MGEGYRGQISTLVEGKKQVIKTAPQWTGGVFAKCCSGALQGSGMQKGALGLENAWRRGSVG